VSASDKNPEGAAKIPGKEALRPPLAKRFYDKVTVEDGGAGADAKRPDRYRILLDGRPVKTPRKLPLAVPTRALADAIAAEWGAQGAHIDPASMPLSKLAITAIDGVADNLAAVAEDIVKFAGTDLICYRAEAPAALQGRQSEAWDPILRRMEQELGARFALAEGVMPVAQTEKALDRVAAAVAPFDAMSLASLHVMTTLMGSALLALAHAKGLISLEDAWAAAHVDEDWQVEQWGVDVEATERRARRWVEMQAASRFLKLLAAD
jgi:chaperone required for assembly of F1-ATPase